MRQNYVINVIYILMLLCVLNFVYVYCIRNVRSKGNGVEKKLLSDDQISRSFADISWRGAFNKFWNIFGMFTHTNPWEEYMKRFEKPNNHTINPIKGAHFGEWNKNDGTCNILKGKEINKSELKEEKNIKECSAKLLNLNNTNNNKEYYYANWDPTDKCLIYKSQPNCLLYKLNGYTLTSYSTINFKKYDLPPCIDNSKGWKINAKCENNNKNKTYECKNMKWIAENAENAENAKNAENVENAENAENECLRTVEEPEETETENEPEETETENEPKDTETENEPEGTKETAKKAKQAEKPEITKELSQVEELRPTEQLRTADEQRTEEEIRTEKETRPADEAKTAEKKPGRTEEEKKAKGAEEEEEKEKEEEEEEDKEEKEEEEEEEEEGKGVPGKAGDTTIKKNEEKNEEPENDEKIIENVVESEETKNTINDNIKTVVHEAKQGMGSQAENSVINKLNKVINEIDRQEKLDKTEINETELNVAQKLNNQTKQIESDLLNNLQLPNIFELAKNGTTSSSGRYALALRAVDVTFMLVIATFVL